MGKTKCGMIKRYGKENRRTMKINWKRFVEDSEEWKNAVELAKNHRIVELSMN